MSTDFVTPHQVLQAIEYAKKINKNDTNGDGAFRINFKRVKPGENGVSYLNFEVLKEKTGGKWEYVLLNLKFMNLITRSKLLAPDDPKRKLPGIQLQFAHDASYTSKSGKKDKNGKDIIIDEPYSKVKILIAEAFTRIIMSALAKEELYAEVNKISTSVQTTKKSDQPSGKRVKLDEPIIRTEIKFTNPDTGDKTNNGKKENKIDPNATPKCELYDVTKPIPASDPRYASQKFEVLKYEKDGELQDITYSNIRFVIPPGSSVSGIDCMSSVTKSNMGIGLPSKLTLGMVKPSKGFKPDPSTVFDMNDMGAMGDAQTVEIQETNEDDDNSDHENINKNAFDSITNTNTENIPDYTDDPAADEHDLSQLKEDNKKDIKSTTKKDSKNKKDPKKNNKTNKVEEFDDVDEFA